MEPEAINQIGQLADLLHSGGNVATLALAYFCYNQNKILEDLKLRLSKIEWKMGIDEVGNETL